MYFEYTIEQVVNDSSMCCDAALDRAARCIIAIASVVALDEHLACFKTSLDRRAAARLLIGVGA